MTTDLRFTVEVATKGSNAREHHHARATRVNRERDAVAIMWRQLVHRVVPGYGIVHPDCFVSEALLRFPRGVSQEARKLAKRTGADLRVMDSVLRPLVPLDVHLTRVSAGELDDDNLHAALKGCRDQLAREMGIDDRDSVVRWHVHQERGPRKYHAVKVQIVARESMRRDSPFPEGHDTELMTDEPKPWEVSG